jgi:aryl-alcohol dehydrogenase-like predicted oxidoreductase
MEVSALDHIRLGGLDVPVMGLGCMGMSEHYGPTDWDRSIATIHRAIELDRQAPRRAAHMRAGRI